MSEQKTFWTAQYLSVGDVIRLDEHKFSELDEMLANVEEEAKYPIFGYFFKGEHERKREAAKTIKLGGCWFNKNDLGQIGMGPHRKAALEILAQNYRNPKT